MRKVPFFNYPFVFKNSESQILDIVKDVGRRGAFIMQEDLQRFEQNLATFVGAKHSLGVGNATDAMEMFLAAAGINPGDEIIICSHTMIATASAIHAVGAIPVPVEAGEDHLIDPEAIRGALTSKTRALMPTQLNGRTCDMDAVQQIADRWGLLLFEDSAQALGSKFKGKGAGTFGLAACVSFYPAKNLGALGDGGAILCNDDELYSKLRSIRDHGRTPDGDIPIWGRNSRLDNVQAAILDHFLGQYPSVVARRRQIASIYQRRLEGVSAIKLPPAPDQDPDHFDVYQNYEVDAADRDELKRFLADRNIGTMIQWGGRPVHSFKKLGFRQELPRTDRLFERMLMLPMNMSLSDEDVHYVCEAVESFYGTR